MMNEAKSTVKAGAPRRLRKVRTGTVVSDKMDKTVVVKIERMKMHTRYKKYIRIWNKVKAHDEQNSAHVGDLVQIVETRPLSKDKHWRVAKVLKRAEI